MQEVKKKKKVKVPKVVNGVETMVEIEVDDVSGPAGVRMISTLYLITTSDVLMDQSRSPVSPSTRLTSAHPGCSTAVSCAHLMHTLA